MNVPYYSTNEIHNAYIAQTGTILPFFEQPLSPDWPALCKKVTGQFKNHTLVEELVRQNTPALHESAQKNLAWLQSGNAAIVITGQQLGLMVSPLYTVYKILTALKLAQELNEHHEDLNVVPVFWLEGEDHDFDEINHTCLWNNDGTPERLMLEEREGEQNHSISKRYFAEGIQDLHGKLDQLLAETEFKPALIEKLLHIYQSGADWLNAFREHIRLLLADYGLLCFNPADARVKELSQPFFEHLLVHNAELRAHFRTSSETLERAGFFNQVKVLEDRSYIFFNHEGKIRQPLFVEGDTYFLRDPEQHYSLHELKHLLHDHPDWYSSSVLTRPLWQSWMLPVISYIAGPGEVAYWAQLKSAFSGMELVMPQVMPRSSLTLIEPRIERLMKKYDIGLTDLSGSKEAFIRSHIASTLPEDMEEQYEVFLKQLHDFQHLLDVSARNIDETLGPVVAKSFGSVEATFDKLKNRFIRRIEEKETLMHRHLESVYEAVLPYGKLQERMIGAVYFQNKYGIDWIARVYSALNIHAHEHQVLHL